MSQFNGKWDEFSDIFVDVQWLMLGRLLPPVSSAMSQ